MTTSDNQNSGNGRSKTTPDELLAAAIATGCSIKEAAKRARMSQSTAYRRWNDSAFRLRVSELRGGVVAASLGRLTEVMTKAVSTLEALLDGESEMVRLGAARAVLEHSTKLRESVEMAERIRRLEDLLASEGQHG